MVLKSDKIVSLAKQSVPRIRLGVAVALMFLAGLWIWANTLPRKAWLVRTRQVGITPERRCWTRKANGILEEQWTDPMDDSYNLVVIPAVYAPEDYQVGGYEFGFPYTMADAADEHLGATSRSRRYHLQYIIVNAGMGIVLVWLSAHVVAELMKLRN